MVGEFSKEMKKNTFPKITTAVALILVLCDQVIKYFVNLHQPDINAYLFRISFAKNTGAAFGTFTGNNTVFIWISLIILGLFLFYHDKFTKTMKHAGIIIAGGIVSNLLDRLQHGYVVDYINFGWFPIFNIGDSMIVVGTLYLGWLIYKDDNTKKKK